MPWVSPSLLSSSGSSGVETVTGSVAGLVDNTDPTNPVILPQAGVDGSNTILSVSEISPGASYPLLNGLVNGSNTVYQVTEEYFIEQPTVLWNGAVYYTFTASLATGTVTLADAPVAGEDIIGVLHNK